MSRGGRTKVARNIYRDQYGYAVVARVQRAGQAHSKELRFPADAVLEAMQAAQLKARADLLTTHPKRGGHAARVRDSFARACVRYLKLIAGRPGTPTERSNLKAWIEQFGNRDRHTITSQDVLGALADWRTTGQRRRHQKIVRPLTPQTLRHRYRVLKKLYKTLDGPQARTPCDDIPRPKVPDPVPQDVNIATIRRVAKQLHRHDPLTHARFLVLATTGKAPTELMRATPTDIDWRRRTWRVLAAKGRRPQIFPLNDEMVAALKRFKAVNGWGLYDTTRYARILRRCGWPAHIKPYKVRQAVALELLRRGADLGDVQAHLGHVSPETTRKAYAAVLAHRARQTSRRLEGRLGLLS